MTDIKLFKTDPNAFEPVYSTTGSACFDLKACLVSGHKVKGYNHNDESFDELIRSDGTVNILSGERILIPTGLIFDIPRGYSMRIHPRSGLALKSGIVLANMEGVVDSDYVEETYIMVYNMSEVNFWLKHGMKIAQGEIVPIQQSSFSFIQDRPTQKTDRVGGFGSTGV